MPRVVIPWGGSCRHRRLALDYVQARYAELGWPVTLAPGGSPWIKAKAVMPAVAACSETVLVIADADVWSDGIPEAVGEIEERKHQWAKPHRSVYRLTEKSTEQFIAGADHRDLELERSRYFGVAGGGIVVARRETLLDVPMDPRFVGWGQEDAAWALALSTLAGEPSAGKRDLIHLYHPAQPRLSARMGSTESWRLFRRYKSARRSPQAMRSLLEEIHVDDPDQPAVHGSSPG